MNVMILRMKSPAQYHTWCACLISARLTPSRPWPLNCRYVHIVENVHHLLATRAPPEAVGAPAVQNFESDMGSRRLVTKAFISPGRKLLFAIQYPSLLAEVVRATGAELPAVSTYQWRHFTNVNQLSLKLKQNSPRT